MDLALRHHRRLRAEALDNAAHERADAGEVTSTGASPSRAAASNFSRTSVDAGAHMLRQDRRVARCAERSIRSVASEPINDLLVLT